MPFPPYISQGYSLYWQVIPLPTLSLSKSSHLSMRRILAQLALQTLAMNAQLFRGPRDIAVTTRQHVLDIFPFVPGETRYLIVIDFLCWHLSQQRRFNVVHTHRL